MSSFWPPFYLLTNLLWNGNSFPPPSAAFLTDNAVSMLIPLATLWQILTLSRWNKLFAPMKTRNISTGFLNHQSSITLSACSAITSADKTDCTAAFYTTLKVTTHRADCCGYQHERSSDCQGVRMSTTTRKHPSIGASSLSVFFHQHVYSTPGASPDAGWYTAYATFSRASKQRIEIWQILTNSCKLLWDSVITCETDLRTAGEGV